MIAQIQQLNSGQGVALIPGTVSVDQIVQAARNIAVAKLGLGWVCVRPESGPGCYAELAKMSVHPFMEFHDGLPATTPVLQYDGEIGEYEKPAGRTDWQALTAALEQQGIYNCGHALYHFDDSAIASITGHNHRHRTSRRLLDLAFAAHSLTPWNDLESWPSRRLQALTKELSMTSTVYDWLTGDKLYSVDRKYVEALGERMGVDLTVYITAHPHDVLEAKRQVTYLETELATVEHLAGHLPTDHPLRSPFVRPCSGKVAGTRIDFMVAQINAQLQKAKDTFVALSSNQEPVPTDPALFKVIRGMEQCGILQYVALLHDLIKEFDIIAGIEPYLPTYVWK